MKKLHWVDRFIYLGRKFTTEREMDGKTLGSTNIGSKVIHGRWSLWGMKEKNSCKIYLFLWELERSREKLSWMQWEALLSNTKTDRVKNEC